MKHQTRIPSRTW